MIRALDFTAEPDNDYRYRVRIVVFNPNHNRDDVSNRGGQEGHRASRPLERADRRGDHAGRRRRLRHGRAAGQPQVGHQGRFPGHRFDPSRPQARDRALDRSTRSPARSSARSEPPTSPSPTARARRPSPMDFNTPPDRARRRGGLHASAGGLAGRRFERPALALLLKPDGSVLARNQADDATNEVRKDIERNYAREIKDSNKEREEFDGQRLRRHDGGDDGRRWWMGGMGGYGGMGGGGRR